MGKKLSPTIACSLGRIQTSFNKNINQDPDVQPQFFNKVCFTSEITLGKIVGKNVFSIAYLFIFHRKTKKKTQCSVLIYI